MPKIFWTTLTTACIGLGIAGCTIASPYPDQAQLQQALKQEVQQQLQPYTDQSGQQATPSASAPNAAPTKAGDYLAVGVMTNGRGVCNSDSFTQIPGNTSLFVGRSPLADPTKCSNQWTLSTFNMDWATRKLELKSTLLNLPVSISAGPQHNVTLATAYDPFATVYNHELWVAFECGGQGFTGGASTCIAPIDEQTMQINPSRITMIVSGVRDTQKVVNYSASDPKLFAYNGSLYLYWTIVHQDVKTGQFLDTMVRGMKVVEEPAGARRMWGQGSNGQAVASIDPNLTSVVLAPKASDPRANRIADVFDVRQIGSRILVTAGIGGEQGGGDGESCATPSSKNFGCYRLEIFEAQEPLGTGVFGHRILANSPFPLNGQEYSRFVHMPDGSLAIMGRFLPVWDKNPLVHGQIMGENKRARVASALLIHRIDPDSFQFTNWN